MNVGSEKTIKAVSPPRNDAVAYIDIHVSNCVDVGPGIDWHIVIN